MEEEDISRASGGGPVLQKADVSRGCARVLLAEMAVRELGRELANLGGAEAVMWSEPSERRRGGGGGREGGGNILDCPAVSGRFRETGMLFSNPIPGESFSAGQPETWCSDVPRLEELEMPFPVH